MATERTFPAPSVAIVAPDGERVSPDSDQSEVIALDIVRAQQIHLARLQSRMGARQHRIVRSAIEETAARVLALQWRGNDPWNQARLLRTLLLLSRAMTQMVGIQRSQLTEDLKVVGRQSQLDAARYLATLDRKFHGSVRPLHFDSLAWFDETNRNIGRTRIRNYTNSWLRYGARVTSKIEDTLAQTAITGEPWYTAREKVMAATADAVNRNQYWVDRILRTESSAHWNGTQLAALQAEDEPDDPMLKKLVSHFDDVTGRDSVLLHGQTRHVDKPFYDAVNRITYMAPPNRPHDREVVVGWRTSYGDDFNDFDKETATGYDEEIHGATPKDLDQDGQARDPTGPMRGARPRRAKPSPTEPTPAERRDQLAMLRWKRDYIAEQLDDARKSVTRLRRQFEQAIDAELGAGLREQLSTQSGLALSLTQQLEEHRTWIDQLERGTLLPPAATR